VAYCRAVTNVLEKKVFGFQQDIAAFTFFPSTQTCEKKEKTISPQSRVFVLNSNEE